MRTWTLELQSVVSDEILAPDTPGGFSSNMEVSVLSSSATHDDMIADRKGQVMMILSRKRPAKDKHL